MGFRPLELLQRLLRSERVLRSERSCAPAQLRRRRTVRPSSKSLILVDLENVGTRAFPRVNARKGVLLSLLYDTYEYVPHRRLR